MSLPGSDRGREAGERECHPAEDGLGLGLPNESSPELSGDVAVQLARYPSSVYMSRPGDPCKRVRDGEMGLCAVDGCGRSPAGEWASSARRRRRIRPSSESRSSSSRSSLDLSAAASATRWRKSSTMEALMAPTRRAVRSSVAKHVLLQFDRLIPIVSETSARHYSSVTPPSPSPTPFPVASFSFCSRAFSIQYSRSRFLLLSMRHMA